jgi:uncharacterized SAM-binding protein YcdF (DUF218 family)
MKKPRKRLRFALLAGGSGVLLFLVVLLAYGPILATFGRWLVFQKTEFQEVDSLVVLEGSVPDRACEAGELFKLHRGRRIVLVREKRDRDLKQLEEFGFQIPGDCDLNRAILLKLGVPEHLIEVVPGDVDSTWEEALAFSRHARNRKIRSAAVITCPFHTRRAYLNFRKACAPDNVTIYVVASRYCEQDPSGWWKERDQLKLVYVEVANLGAYYLGFR